MSDFASHLRGLRERSGLTRHRLSRLSGISQEGLSTLEEPGSDPKLSTLFKLAAAFGVSARDLIPDPTAETQPPVTKARTFSAAEAAAVDDALQGLARFCRTHLDGSGLSGKPGTLVQAAREGEVDRVVGAVHASVDAVVASLREGSEERAKAARALGGMDEFTREVKTVLVHAMAARDLQREGTRLRLALAETLGLPEKAGRQGS
jgi:transcriptional regulator with XRE-family HTH domain